MILILTAGRPRQGEDQEGEPAGGGCSLAGPRGSGRRLGTDAQQHLPRAAPALLGLRSPQGPRVPSRRKAAVPAPPRPLGAWEHPSPRTPPPPVGPELRSLVPTPTPTPQTSTDSLTGLDTPIAASCSSQLRVGTQGLACPRAAGEPAAKDGQSRCEQPERRPRAQPSAEKLFRLRRAAGREVPARPSGEAGRGGGRALAHWPAWSPRPRDNNKAPTPGA